MLFHRSFQLCDFSVRLIEVFAFSMVSIRVLRFHENCLRIVLVTRLVTNLSNNKIEKFDYVNAKAVALVLEI